MANFEVFIPATEEAGFDLTLRVEAENWISALKTGMSKVGLKGPGGNIFCDIKDDSIHVTDPLTQKVFRIRELAEDQPPAAPPSPTPPSAAPAAPAAPEPPGMATEPAMPKVEVPTSTEPSIPKFEAPATTEPSMPAVSPPEPSEAPPAPEPPPAPAAAPPAPEPPAAPAAVPPAPEPPGVPAAPPAPEPPPAPAAAPPAAPEPPPAPAAAPAPHRRAPEPKVLEVSRTQTSPSEVRETIGRPPVQVDIEEILADLFMRSQEVFDFPSREAAMAYILDLATEKVPCESASVYRAEISTRNLFFSAAKGPKAKELLALNPRIPVGTGLAGFVVEEGVAIAISDVHRDPRFFKTISQKLGYECKSIITVPVQMEGQVMGAIQLINRLEGTSFCETDMSILNYLAHEIAEYLRRTGDVTV